MTRNACQIMVWFISEEGIFGCGNDLNGFRCDFEILNAWGFKMGRRSSFGARGAKR